MSSSDSSMRPAPHSTSSGAWVSRSNEFSAIGRHGWLLVGFFVVTFAAAAVWVFLRTFNESTVFQPPIHPNAELRPQATGIRVLSPFFRLGYDFRITHVDEWPVGTLDDYHSALRANGTRALRLKLESPDVEAPREMLLSRAPAFPDLARALDANLTVVDPLPIAFYNVPIQPGDRLTHVEGHQINSPEEIGALEKFYPPAVNGVLQWYTLERPGVGPVALLLYKIDWRTHWMLYAAGLMFGVLGFVVFTLKPYTRSAWGFLFFCWAFGLFWLLRSIAAQTRTIPEYYVFQALQALLPLPAMVLLVTFSPLRLVFPRVWPVAAAMGAFGAGLVAVNQFMNPGQVYLSRPIFSVWGLSMLGVLLWGMSMDLILRLRGAYVGTAERLRGRVVRLACLMAFGPVVFHTLFSLWTDIWNYQMWFELCVLLFPLIIGYAIVKHDMLHIREMLAQGSVLFGLLIAVAVLFSQGSALAEALAERVPAIDPDVPRTVMLMALVGLVVVSYNPLRQRIHAYYDRVDPLLETFVSDLELEDFFSLRPREFFANMLRRLGETGKMEFLTLDLFQPQAGWWLGGKTGLAPAGPTTQECAALFTLMSSSPTEISSEGISDDLRLSGVREQLARAMKAVKASLVLPLVSENRLLGIMTLGDKENFHNRTPAELATLRRLASSCTGYVEKQFELAQESVTAAREGRPLQAVCPIAMGYPQCPPWIGPYRVERPLGKGGMAVVFLGREDGAAKSVALKVPNVMVQHNEEMLRRFMMEGRLMREMDHPNLMRVIDVGKADREPYLVMPYLAHGSLADRLRERRVRSESEARRIVAGIARGLAHALVTQHIFHRDIKPANIMMGADGEPIVADFGLAKVLDGSQISAVTHQMVGTLPYMSPEVCAGRDRDWKADQYALGIMLFEMLTGRRPFESDDQHQLMLQHIHASPPDLRDLCPGVSDGMVDIVKRLLQKRPEDRFPAYKALIEALESEDPGEAPTMVGAAPRPPDSAPPETPGAGGSEAGGTLPLPAPADGDAETRA